MPHGARKQSESGYYHVVVKGIADQLVFEEDADRKYYVELMKEGKAESGVTLHAYCLMSNHVHLVVEALGAKLARFMKHVNELYGMYYAKKSGRSGGVFKKPFWSEPIESDEYLLCAVRYVHANPALAGICPASAYEWSSARDYLGRGGIADTSMVLDMCDGVDGFIKFSRAQTYPGAAFPGSLLRNHLTDDEALRVAKHAVGEEMIAKVKTLACSERRATIYSLRDAGLSGKQIVRITGLGKTAVYNAFKK